ncbi:MAG TPA: alpha/beta fold hydrolase [Spirochaetia bacterium]|nr:alpha/beta fold hydrolase [Spirochaetia bacterium]
MGKRGPIASVDLRGYTDAVDLAFRDLGGDGPAIVFLHGLFGSSQNWAGMGRRLSHLGRCLLLDLRNHGDSPHAPTHTLADCMQDVVDWAQLHAHAPLRLIGHSMGGLVAMGFALTHPELTAGVASLDIAPRVYAREHGRELRALRTDISLCRSRAELDALISPILPDAAMRQFILTNAVHDGEGFRWRLNVPVLATSTLNGDFVNVHGRFDGPATLVAGGRSPYVTRADHAVMLHYFPRAVIRTIPGADHWLNASAADEVAGILTEFLHRTMADAIKEPGFRP